MTSLAAVSISPSEWNKIYGHVLTYKPQHGNMHLRQARIVNGERELRYLHAMKANAKKEEIEAIISGPDIFCHYKMFKNSSGKIQINVISEDGTTREKKRLAKRFLLEILNRIDQEENSGETPFSNYSEGEFYLKRRNPGMPISHPNCKAALNADVLDRLLLEKLVLWNFELVHP